MKERITFIVPDDGQAIDPATIRLDERRAHLPGFRAAKERRITLAREEVPSEIKAVLKDSHELHIRWTSSQHHVTHPPFSARTPPGLHVFYTPLSRRQLTSVTEPLGEMYTPDVVQVSTLSASQENLQSVIEVQRDQPFSQPQVISERFSSSSAYQYYQPLDDSANLLEFLQSAFCQSSTSQTDCTNQVQSLTSATSLSFDYDAISQTVALSALWPPARQVGAITSRSAADRVEIGFFNREASEEFEEVALGGFLAVLGEDEHPKPTLFSFPSRHRQIPTGGAEALTYSASFRQPTGLHPVLEITLPRSDFEPPLPACRLHTYLTLPSTLFVDRYQFSDPLFLESNNLVALRSLSGETDLEAPEWTRDRWGSAALLQLASASATELTPNKTALSGHWTASIPLHLRYLAPLDRNSTNTTTNEIFLSNDQSAGPGKRTIPVPYPILFWACPALLGTKMATNPFDRVDLGYDGIFGTRTSYWHITPRPLSPTSDHLGALEVEKGGSVGVVPGTLYLSLHVPVLDRAGAATVELGTAVVVLAGFVWICFKLFRGAPSRQSVGPVVLDKKVM